ncbi:MAG: chemotaxis protein CheW [Anaerolineae bacterium]|nr:chemotaxis protein CheW [Anaerolineae bacterium]
MSAERMDFEAFDDVADTYVRQIWAKRALRLAQAPGEEDQGIHTPLVLIRLGVEIYALDARYVFEIRPAEQVTPVPRTPAWVAGIVNVRGRIVSVIDLRQYLGLPTPQAPEEKHAQYLLVVETATMELALLADEVLAVESVPESRIQEAGDTMVLSISPDYVRGIVKNRTAHEPGNALHAEPLHGALWVILNLPALLGDKKLIIQEELT